jgi:hypothetical protein
MMIIHRVDMREIATSAFRFLALAPVDTRIPWHHVDVYQAAAEPTEGTRLTVASTCEVALTSYRYRCRPGGGAAPSPSPSDPTDGSALILPAYAAVYLGAAAIRPGRINALGALVGRELLGTQSYYQQVFYGVAQVAAIPEGDP